MKTFFYATMLFGLSFIFLAGCNDPIYVDADNIQGYCHDGSEACPWLTINQAIQDLDGDPDTIDIILVAPGTYNENITLPYNVNLWPSDRSDSPPIIEGNDSDPTITAEGNNSIERFIIRGGSRGIQFDVSESLGDHNPFAEVIDCEIYNTTGEDPPAHGIEVIANMDSAASSRANSWVDINLWGNYIHDIEFGDGIHLELIGSVAGVDQIEKQWLYPDIRENIILRAHNGISLKVEGTCDDIRDSFLIENIIKDNLIIHNYADGIKTESTSCGKIAPTIAYNTIADNESDGIQVYSDSGAYYAAFQYNIIANNHVFGIREENIHFINGSVRKNIFHDNGRGLYYDFDESNIINSEEELSGLGLNVSGNLVADPLFASGIFFWNGEVYDNAVAHYFLSQNGASISPAVDAGPIDFDDPDLENPVPEPANGLNFRTTCTDGLIDDAPLRKDTGYVDIGFHYSIAH